MPDEGFTGYWINAQVKQRCSTCFRNDGRTLRLTFGNDTVCFCDGCATALRELLIDALEDDDAQR